MIYDISQRLLECIAEMGRQHTNAVLLTLDGIDSIKPYQRYPENAYRFGNGMWRVFYHCHTANILDNREHGHFHFFTRTSNDAEWSHVIALGIDSQGQPVNLFTTNLWVTDGGWFDASQLGWQMQMLNNSDDSELPLAWFKYLLLLYKDTITTLLQERDVKLKHYCPHDQQQCFIDRSIYYLSQTTIDLHQRLLRVFEEDKIYHG